MDTSAIELETVLAQAEALAQSDPHSALSMLEAISDMTGDQEPATQARRHYLQARLLVNAGEPRAALRHIDAARDNWQACGQVLRALRSDLGRMNVLDDLGQHRQAAAVGRQLLATIDAVDPQTFGDDIAEATWLRAAAGENLAVALGYLGEHAAALHSHLDTEAAYAELGLKDDVARSWANQGLQLLELGRVDEAAQVLRTAAEHFEAVDDRLSQGRALAFLSRAELRSGHIVAARATIDLAKRSLAGLQKSPTWAQLQIELAEACCTLGLLDEAEEAQTSVIESFADNSRSPERIQALLNRGITRLAGGRPHDAAPDLQQAADGYVELGDPVGQARSLVALSRAGEGVTALASARHALALLDTTHPADLAEALVRTAECELDPTAAAAALDRARDVAAGLAMPALDWQIRTCAGRVARAGGDLAAALEHFEAAHEITSTQRSNLAFELHRVGFLASRAQVVEELVATLLDNGEVDRALEIIGTDRSQTLTDRLHGRIDAVTAMHSHELDAIYSGLLTAPQTEAAALVRRARHLETPLSRPATAKPRRSASNAAVAQVVMQTVGADLFAFVDGAAGVRTARLARVLDIAREVERLGAIRRRAMNSELADRHGPINQAIGAEVLASLSEMLIDPLVELFGGRLPSDMQIVPDASVAGVPFAALS
ncbi:MAG: hypothetical protein KDB16_18715, partial [Acidimicrobiales bacterium]|nr:hypothetical protein [Acidimicrobiales bacterium]